MLGKFVAFEFGERGREREGGKGREKEGGVKSKKGQENRRNRQI